MNFAGEVVGFAGDGTAVTGRVDLNVMVNEAIWGAMTFDEGWIGLHSRMSDLTENFALITDGESHFFGGTVASRQNALEGRFYGPDWQTIGGDWAFEVDGGARPGGASGEFGANR